MVKDGATDGYHPPWEIVDRAEADLDDTIAAFDKLVDAIESRMPLCRTQKREWGLVDKSVLDSLHVMQYGQNYSLSEFGIAHAFMAGVQRPRFKYIAPGISVPTETTITDQPFFDPKIVETSEIREGIQRLDGEFQPPPFLLFRSNSPVPLPALDYNKAHYPFSWPWNTLQFYHAGLYLHSFSDAFTFALPYGIGRNGYARATDGSRFGERVDKKGQEVWPKNRYADLYRVGYHPFVVNGRFGLKDVLENWIGMVERGDWKVEDDGIAIGINEWKKADTAKHWEKYVLTL